MFSIVLDKILTLEGLLASFLMILSAFILYFIKNFSGRISGIEKSNNDRLNEIFSGMLVISKALGDINNDMLSKFSKWEDRIKDILAKMENSLQKQKNENNKLVVIMKKFRLSIIKEIKEINTKIKSHEDELKKFQEYIKDNPVKNLSIIIDDTLKDIHSLKTEMNERKKETESALEKISQIMIYIEKSKGTN